MVDVVFLDRDGLINKYPGHGNYVTKVKDFHFLPGAREAIRQLTDEGYKIFVISNQAGVGKGVFSRNKLDRINRKLLSGIQAAGGKVLKTLYCTHRPDEGCDCRKPGIGMLKVALKTINRTITSAKDTYFVGDTQGDIQTGYNAGCTTILSLSGRDNRLNVRSWSVKPDYIVKDLREAAKIITHENPRHTRNRGRRS